MDINLNLKEISSVDGTFLSGDKSLFNIYLKDNSVICLELDNEVIEQLELGIKEARFALENF